MTPHHERHPDRSRSTRSRSSTPARGASPKFNQIVANIAALGLKKPITVTPREGKNGDARYDLVCGQGRLQGCKELGYAEVRHRRRPAPSAGRVS